MLTYGKTFKMTRKKIKIYLLPKFKKSLKDSPRHVADKLEKKKQLFRQNPFHPSLKTHKLKGVMQNYYSFSVDYSYRVIFKFMSEDKVLFINIGTHEVYK